MTITHRAKSGGSALTAPSSDSGGQIDDKEPPKYHCDACSNDVTNTVRIRCADKNCPDFDLCVTCFCSGSEPVKHKTWHEYRVVKPHSFPIFDADWDADEELLLIQGAEKNGIGNWPAIAAYVGTRSKHECEQHYLDVYVNSPHWPVPRMDCVFDQSEAESRERKRRRLEASRAPKKAAPINTKPITSAPTFHEIQGYMPKRKEFETEVENEAEHSVKDMVFMDDDTPEEVLLKVMVLDIYNSRLDKRMERRNVIFDRNWLEFKKLQAQDRRRPKDERDVYNKTRLYCRLQTAEDYDTFCQGLIREQQLRERMATLVEWRRAGLVSFKHGDQYERDKQQRLNHLKTVAALSNDRINGPYQRGAALRAQMAALAPCHGAAYYRDNGHSPSMPYSHATKRIGNDELADLDGLHLLTRDEADLCAELSIKPRPYLVLKDALLKTYARQGYLKYKQAKHILKIDSDKVTRLYDFFVEQGWIKHWQDPAIEMLFAPPPAINAPTPSTAAAAMLATIPPMPSSSSSSGVDDASSTTAQMPAWDDSLLPDAMDPATAAAAMAQLTSSYDTNVPPPSSEDAPSATTAATHPSDAMMLMDENNDDALNAAMMDPSIQVALLEDDLLAPPTDPSLVPAVEPMATDEMHENTTENAENNIDLPNPNPNPIDDAIPDPTTPSATADADDMLIDDDDDEDDV